MIRVSSHTCSPDRSGGWSSEHFSWSLMAFADSFHYSDCGLANLTCLAWLACFQHAFHSFPSVRSRNRSVCSGKWNHSLCFFLSGCPLPPAPSGKNRTSWKHCLISRRWPRCPDFHRKCGNLSQANPPWSCRPRLTQPPFWQCFPAYALPFWWAYS